MNNFSKDDACNEIATTIKHMIREWGGSREDMVAAINNYFCSSETDEILSIHMFNHYLSKPVKYPIPAFLIFAIQRVTGSLGLSSCFAKTEDAQVINKEEAFQFAIGKIDAEIAERRARKKQLMGIKR